MGRDLKAGAGEIEVFRRRVPKPLVPTEAVGWMSDYALSDVDGGRYDPAELGAIVHRPAFLRDLVAEDTATRKQVIAELLALSDAHGGWVAIGVWRWLFWDFDRRLLAEAPRALDNCVRAFSELGVPEPGWFMNRVEADRWEELYGSRAPADAPPGPSDLSRLP